MNKVLFAVGAWGLGHATRDLPLIEGLLERGCEVTVASSGPALSLLREHLGNRCQVLSLPEMPTPLGRNALHFYCRFLFSLRGIWNWVHRDRLALEAILSKYPCDIIFSDNRYGISSPYIPSYHIAHQIRFIAPGRSPALEHIMLAVHSRLLEPARLIFVPDIEGSHSLSGDLSHRLPQALTQKLKYIGILSSLSKAGVAEDLDYFITVSGAEPQRGILQELVLRKLAGLPGRGIVALGLPGQRSHERIGNAEVYGFLNRQEQQEAMARSHVVVARAGYSTIMELAALGKKAVLVPTPGQTEQGYLARRHQRLGSCHSVQQGSLDPPRDIARALKLPGFRAPNTTGEAVERFVEGFLADLKRGAAPLPTLRPSPFR